MTSSRSQQLPGPPANRQYRGSLRPQGQSAELEPGIGKSAICARLSNTRSDVAAIHFCSGHNVRTVDPQEFVASLVGQFQARIPGFAEIVEAADPGLRRNSPAVAFEELIREPLRKVKAPTGPRKVVVDGLDEACKGRDNEILDLIVKDAGALPAWIRFFVTARPLAQVMDQTRNFRIVELRHDRID